MKGLISFNIGRKRIMDEQARHDANLTVEERWAKAASVMKLVKDSGDDVLVSKLMHSAYVSSINVIQ